MSTGTKRRLRVASLSEGELVLGADAAHYLKTVLRLGVGARLTAFDRGREAPCEIVAIADASVTLACGAIAAMPPARSITIVYSLSKGDKVDAVVRDAVELGATRIVVTRTERSIVSLDAERGEKKRERWSRIAEEAARQSGRADVPDVLGPLDFQAALRHVQTTHQWILDPSAPAALIESLGAALDGDASIAFAIGPEGGFTPSELVLAAEHGFAPASFGRTTLRTETVAAAVLGAVAVIADRGASEVAR